MNRPAALQSYRLRAPLWGRWLLLAVFLQALLPAGYMPAVFIDAHAALPITVCSQGMPSGFQPLHTYDHSPATPVVGAQHCVFSAASSGPALLPSLPLLAVAVARPGSVPALAFPLAFCGVRCGPPVGSRAPPFLPFS